MDKFISEQVQGIIKDLQDTAEELIIASHMYAKGQDTYYALSKRIQNNAKILMKIIAEKPEKKSILKRFLDRL